VKINVEIDMKDFYDEFDDMETVIKNYLRDEIMRIVKKDPRYKAFVNAKAAELLNDIKL